MVLAYVEPKETKPDLLRELNLSFVFFHGPRLDPILTRCIDLIFSDEGPNFNHQVLEPFKVQHRVGWTILEGMLLYQLVDSFILSVLSHAYGFYINFWGGCLLLDLYFITNLYIILVVFPSLCIFVKFVKHMLWRLGFIKLGFFFDV